MNKKQKISIVVLVILIILFLITKLNDKTERRISFFDIDSVLVEKIEIIAAGDTLLLAKSSSGWMLSYPIEYPISPQKMEQFFEDVMKVETSNLPISEEEGSFETYKLTDSLATTLKIYGKNDKLLDHSLVGKSSSYNNSPARKQGSNKIFRLEKNITSYLKTDPKQWRKREVMELDNKQIAKISILYKGTGYELTATDTLWQYEDGEESITIQHSNPTLRTILNSLSKVNVTDFIDEEIDGILFKLHNPALEIGINMYDGRKYYLRAAKDEENKYILQVNNDTEHLYTIYENWLKKFQNKAEDFRK
ncbi:MAG: DUF4340 domain-containing protein [Candidatus Cloacimonetes bacterium]|nr:DUF4340 domain-containing protein [Candidatus Cloacimonadota bacterium]MBL7148592.1 DUF4340 domain-containing protein [Candidatus Cloacimonadota bacterium]